MRPTLACIEIAETLEGLSCSWYAENQELNIFMRCLEAARAASGPAGEQANRAIEFYRSRARAQRLQNEQAEQAKDKQKCHQSIQNYR